MKWPDLTFPPINLWVVVCAKEWYEMSDNMSDYKWEQQELLEQGELELMHDAADSITNDVIADLRTRESLGRIKYGKYLTPNTDEDMLQHLNEELLDAACYIKTLIKQTGK